MWLDKLKIAIIEKNADAISRLLDDIPQLKDKKEIEEAVYLLKEATSLMHTLKNETSASMKQIKKNLDFLRSTDVHTSKKLDIRS
ncbi:MAG: hypothetical protein A3E21_09640 [Sulfurimonas sp. RIFCSPHIGHO2_12_FULL_36_9]|uniref:hypothetical protein n=1 Tax=Sulfurimonas sp. RIFCSPLOWO2_12_36_12 TaxID=1802253 RepID=UPI0008B90140|nr:hypothetical protein [Sulfurimonas sp. RIFCSPLOWO2_12_36_12]OHD96754.1 MAG: hypothetical protein A3E21_09640 [Sulfurimonas sp. RIFCSPHIGHO2_12_FULL_36_9]OHD98980.1 MAG: hypothetical protein A3J26_04355 [Sulfurimonas sp. RIFCSPLOWO2_02_FULL_36_28]OHE02075.1 MAG: hypothetical protein A2W82_05140 [Sulfurimonas sp. RIFCSPLOWO2_12_36_12]OHE07053.1 MAG: hypothetical protein A3K14_02075 [Sulfurimonas sp. RIFCSPLOWO2_12_FULL_36_74]